jgi:anti-anti-sigma factor
MTAGKAFYVKQSNTYVIKLVGDIRYTMGCSLDDFLNQLFENMDFDDIVVDLGETTCIDSTSLGLLAKIANFMQDRFAKKTTLISTDKDINQLLDSVGFYAVFNICEQCPTCSEGSLRLSISDPSKTELTKTMFEAHSRLSELNDNNREIFKNVVEALKNKLVSEKNGQSA